MAISTSTNNKTLDVNVSKKAINSNSSIAKSVSKVILGKEIEDKMQFKTNNNSTDVEFVNIEPEVSDVGFSNTEYCDEDNINVNQLSKIMVEFQNALTNDGENNEYYEIFGELIKGKRLGDILDENGHVKNSSSFSSDDIAKIQELISSKNLDMSVDEYLEFFDSCVSECSKEGGASVTLNHISDDMLNNVVEEVVSTDNSYDAFVLKNPDSGDYIIVNSCTNAKSTDDLLAIAYAMSMQLTGSLDLIDYVLGYLLPSLDAEMLDDIKSSDLYMELTSGNKAAAKKIEEIYKNELKDNQDLILKYIKKAQEEGTQIGLQGYSLGGGIQLAAYSTLCLENPDLEDYISSVTVFNPYVSFCEENPLNFDGNTVGGNGKDGPLIDYLANSDKLRIYSNEEDYVSTFNNSMRKLIDKYCFINSEDLADHSKVDSIADIYGIVIGSGSNHGFGVIDYDSFENGNITTQGTFYAIDESLSSTTEGDSIGFHFWSEVEDQVLGDDFQYELDYGKIIECSLGLENIREMVSDNGAAAEAFFDYVLKYIKDNVGNYNYDDFSDTIADACWEAIIAGTKEATSYNGGIGESMPDWMPDFLTDAMDETAGAISNGIGNNLEGALDFLGDKDAFIKGIKTFLNKEENTKMLMSAIGETLNGNNVDAKRYFNLLLDSMEVAIGDSDSEIWESYSVSVGPLNITTPSGVVTYATNEFIKKMFIDQLRKVVEEM